MANTTADIQYREWRDEGSPLLTAAEHFQYLGWEEESKALEYADTLAMIHTYGTPHPIIIY